MRRGRARTLFVFLTVGWIAGCAAILGLDEVTAVVLPDPDAPSTAEGGPGGEGGIDAADAADASEVSLDGGCEGSACSELCSVTWDFADAAPMGFSVPQELVIVTDSGLPAPAGSMILNGVDKTLLVATGFVLPCAGQVACDFDVQFSDTSRDVVFARMGNGGGELVRLALGNGKVTAKFVGQPPVNVAAAPPNAWLHIRIQQTSNGAMVSMAAGSAVPSPAILDASKVVGFDLGETPVDGGVAPDATMLIDNIHCANQ